MDCTHKLQTQTSDWRWVTVRRGTESNIPEWKEEISRWGMPGRILDSCGDTLHETTTRRMNPNF